MPELYNQLTIPVYLYNMMLVIPTLNSHFTDEEVELEARKKLHSYQSGRI